ncbi:TauD/TfdA dioxygenase family protein [Novosphingobium resinovorum]|uniref:TauD/TfdA-like domain-containing protein n=1 Tax=Novosphingobium resinovorum TaxID=158500 RepID=A0A1D8AEK5_9SPHN|nr:TauD/TfdA family dioxygenase [Novosphingobium resinovorum]AOR80548.1 hypothetical protein BES08_27265 [Novosphingobium resinovorum]
MSFRTTPLLAGREFGLVIDNVAQEHLDDETARACLRDLWARHGLLIFKGISTIAFQLDLSRVFGPLEPHTVRELRDGEYPELYRLKYDPDNDPWLYDVGGEVLGGFTPWHFDLAFVPLSNRGAMLRSVRLPGAGGKTGFIDGVEAYDRLPAALKAQVDDVEIVYQMDSTTRATPSRCVPRAVRSPCCARTRASARCSTGSSGTIRRWSFPPWCGTRKAGARCCTSRRCSRSISSGWRRRRATTCSGS